jgi:hypothetical protein
MPRAARLTEAVAAAPTRAPQWKRGEDEQEERKGGTRRMRTGRSEINQQKQPT